MRIGLWIVIIILVFIIVGLVIKLRLMKKSADEIKNAFSERLRMDTNTLIDISSHDQHMRNLASAINVQLKLLREERQRFTHGDLELKEAVTNIAHDLRTPLTAIFGYLQLIEREEVKEPVRSYFNMITNRAEALNLLTQELFRYSVITSQQELKLEPISMNEVLEESLAASYGALTQRQIVPKVEIPDEKVVCNLDRFAISRIFENIIANVVKYSNGDFRIKMSEKGVIEFSNTAVNLSEVTVGRLFDRFYTVETGRNSTGLGLSIAKLLTERMGGTIVATYQKDILCIKVSFCPVKKET